MAKKISKNYSEYSFISYKSFSKALLFKSFYFWNKKIVKLLNNICTIDFYSGGNSDGSCPKYIEIK